MRLHTDESQSHYVIIQLHPSDPLENYYSCIIIMFEREKLSYIKYQKRNRSERHHALMEIISKYCIKLFVTSKKWDKSKYHNTCIEAAPY